jgi:hypothetical protein
LGMRQTLRQRARLLAILQGLCGVPEQPQH